jgi:hypothetical protein
MLCASRAAIYKATPKTTTHAHTGERTSQHPVTYTGMDGQGLHHSATPIIYAAEYDSAFAVEIFARRVVNRKYKIK